MSGRPAAAVPAVKPARWRAAALPAEHGSWSFWLEPILLGLLVAPSPAGWLLALASFALFLTRQPLIILWSDYRRGRRYQRTVLAGRFLLVYNVVVVATLLAVWRTAPSTGLWIPLLIVSPLVIIQLIFDLHHESRHWLPEVLGPVILSAFSASIAAASGWALVPALALSAIPISRAVPTVFYVRARLRLEKGQPASAHLSTALHLMAVIGITALASAQLVPVTSILAALILLARAVYGLSRLRRPAQPRHIGIQEIVFGLLAVTMAAAGFHWTI